MGFYVMIENMEFERGLLMAEGFWHELLAVPAIFDWMNFLIGLLFFVFLGAGLGSFVCCQVRRLRLTEEGKTEKSKRSVCLSCGYQLKWYDNIPIVSWLLLRGKCRKCQEKIGVMEILAEILAAILCGLIYWLCYGKDVWMIGFGAVMAVFLLILLGLVLYDAKWKVVPDKMLLLLVVTGFLLSVVRVAPVFGKSFELGIWQILLTMACVPILSGIYYLIYKVSKEKMVGEGDWIVGLALALALGQPILAMLTLFLANFSGTIVALVFLRKKGREIPMVPFFAIGFLLSLPLFELLNLLKII